MRLLFFVLVCFILTSARPAAAEYRAFVLKIKSADGSVKEVTSTLDPDQYPGFYPIKSTDKISYTQTWRCPGRTGDMQPICPDTHFAPAPP